MEHADVYWELVFGINTCERERKEAGVARGRSRLQGRPMVASTGHTGSGAGRAIQITPHWADMARFS